MCAFDTTFDHITNIDHAYKFRFRSVFFPGLLTHAIDLYAMDMHVYSTWKQKNAQTN